MSLYEDPSQPLGSTTTVPASRKRPRHSSHETTGTAPVKCVKKPITQEEEEEEDEEEEDGPPRKRRRVLTLENMGWKKLPTRRKKKKPNPKYRDIYNRSDVPAGSYDLILMDPPWKYPCGPGVGRKGEARDHYPCMDLEALKAVPVPDISNPNGCILLMWVTGPLLPQGIELMKHYGFRYVGVFLNWVCFFL